MGSHDLHRNSRDDGGAPDLALHAPDHVQTQITTAWTLSWGRLLRTARQVAGLSLSELSIRTGLSKGYLSKLESGAASAANPSRATLAALARTLPSFRPLVYTLEPGPGAGTLDFAGLLAARATSGPDERPSEAPGAGPCAMHPDGSPPVQLGWRELEALAALVALDAAALPLPITAPVLARAVGRDTAAVSAVLDRLAAAELVEMTPPARPGKPPCYHLAPGAVARVGAARLGDLLLLAAALIAGTPAGGADVPAGGSAGARARAQPR
jgi:transcriptional regulator with XRE-family HTH domain